MTGDAFRRMLLDTRQGMDGCLPKSGQMDVGKVDWTDAIFTHYCFNLTKN